MAPSRALTGSFTTRPRPRPGMAARPTGPSNSRIPGHDYPSPFDAFPQPVHPPSRRQILPSLRKFRKKKVSLLADIQETAEGASTTVSQPHSRDLSVYPPSGHGRAMDDPNTSMIAVSASPEHQLTLRQPTAQIQGEGGDWQPGDLQGVPNSSGYTLSDNTTLQTIPDVAAGVSEGFDVNRNRQQSNYLRVRQEGASVPSPNCYLSDTDDDASMANDEGNDNFSDRFFDDDCENDNGPRSLKTISRRSFSTWSFQSTRSTSSTDGGATWT